MDSTWGNQERFATEKKIVPNRDQSKGGTVCPSIFEWLQGFQPETQSPKTHELARFRRLLVANQSSTT